MFPPDLTARAAALIARYRAVGLMAATANPAPAGSSRGCSRRFLVRRACSSADLSSIPTRPKMSCSRPAERSQHGAVARRRRGRWPRRAGESRAMSRSASPASPGRTGDGGKAGRPRPFRLRPARRADGRARGAFWRHRPRSRAARLGRGRARIAGSGCQLIGDRPSSPSPRAPVTPRHIRARTRSP